MPKREPATTIVLSEDEELEAIAHSLLDPPPGESDIPPESKAIVQDEDAGDGPFFDPYAPCPECGEFYVHQVPPGTDRSRGIAYPALKHHYTQVHPGSRPPVRRN